MLNFARTSILIASSSLAGLVGCYTAEFDETKPDVYFCVGDDDCLSDQKCSQSVCLDDSGPAITILGPESDPPEEMVADASSLLVSLDVRDLQLVESNAVVEGQGRVLLEVDPHWDGPLTAVFEEETDVFDFMVPLPHGAHRLVATAVYGDHSPYTNPSATTSALFFAYDGTQRPQIGVAAPTPGFEYVLGQPLTIHIFTKRYDLVQAATDCHVPQDCDPFTSDMCTGSEPDPDNRGVQLPCEMSTVGHTHLYLLDNYPDCLMDQPTCNSQYIASVKPEEGAVSDIVKVLEPEVLEEFEPGDYILTAALQYSDHAPYPNIANVVYDQMPLRIVAP